LVYRIGYISCTSCPHESIIAICDEYIEYQTVSLWFTIQDLFSVDLAQLVIGSILVSEVDISNISENALYFI